MFLFFYYDVSLFYELDVVNWVMVRRACASDMLARYISARNKLPRHIYERRMYARGTHTRGGHFYNSMPARHMCTRHLLTGT